MMSYLKILKRIVNQYSTNVKLGKKYSCNVHHTVQIGFDSLNDIELSKGVYIGAYTILSLNNYPGYNNTHLKIGEDTYVGELNNIRASGGKISIGKKCLISQSVSIIAANHLIERPAYIKDQEWDTKKNFVEIGDDVWIGCNSVILPGVKIGTGAIIAAGSIVTKDIPEYSIAMGNPARVSSMRSASLSLSVH